MNSSRQAQTPPHALPVAGAGATRRTSRRQPHRQTLTPSPRSSPDVKDSATPTISPWGFGGKKQSLSSPEPQVHCFYHME